MGAEVQPGSDLPAGGEGSLASQGVNKPEVSMGDQDGHGCVASIRLKVPEKSLQGDEMSKCHQLCRDNENQKSTGR